MLKGERVTLRAMERDDLKRMHELRANVELMTLGHGSWEPTSLAAMEKHFEKNLDREDPSWFVIEADGKVIGDIGLHHRNRRAGATEFGILILDPDYISKGYGRDALEVLLRWAFRGQNWRRVGLQTWSSNERAIRSYLACGFQEEGRMRQAEVHDGQLVDVVVMGLLRDEWEARQAAKS